MDDVAEKLMPPGVRSLRNMLHATAVEVLLYLTPVHCHDMLSSLVEAMNAQFSRFMLRHPDFQVTPAVAPQMSHPSMAEATKAEMTQSMLHLPEVLSRPVSHRCPLRALWHAGNVHNV